MDIVKLEAEPNWGPSGKAVYERTYSRIKPNGERETWADTVARVVDGNLALVPSKYHSEREREELYDLIYNFRAIPAGRQLWMSGVEGRQFLFNCYVSGWGDRLSEHFAFTFSRLIEGGGVGANYSQEYVNEAKYNIANLVRLHIICSPDHPDYEDLRPYLSTEYTSLHRTALQVEDSREGWTEVLTLLIDLATGDADWDYEPDPSGTGVNLPVLVVNVSHLREAGRIIQTFGGTSAGPVPFAKMLHRVNTILRCMFTEGVNGPYCMDLDHAISECIVSGNVRRGARMSIMKWDDPWIEWFLACKSGEMGLDHWSTNISVEIDQEFIDLLEIEVNDPELEISSREFKAKTVYRKIVEGMLNNGEPGIWNSTLANDNEPNRVVSTNPCGEICLEPWENCNLGHINLSAFVDPSGSVDMDGLIRAHELMTRFLIRSTYGDITWPKTKEVNDRNRRIGVGHFGLSGFLAKQKIKFSEAGGSFQLESLLDVLKKAVDDESESYSHTLRIPTPVKRTTVAPTGTIAKLCGDGEGIHPEYARYFIRRIRYSQVDPIQSSTVDSFREQGFRVVEDIYSENTWVVETPTRSVILDQLESMGIHPSYLESVDEIDLQAMLEMQKSYQMYWADNSVSFTINIPKGRYEVTEVMDTLLLYLPFLKGTTLMVDESRELAPYQRISASEYHEMTKATPGEVDDSYNEECSSGACPVK